MVGAIQIADFGSSYLSADMAMVPVARCRCQAGQFACRRSLIVSAALAAISYPLGRAIKPLTGNPDHFNVLQVGCKCAGFRPL